MVKWATTASATESRILFDEIGTHRFFVTPFEPCDQEELIWDGESYEFSILQAEAASVDWDAQVVDQT